MAVRLPSSNVVQSTALARNFRADFTMTRVFDWFGQMEELQLSEGVLGHRIRPKHILDNWAVRICSMTHNYFVLQCNFLLPTTRQAACSII